MKVLIAAASLAVASATCPKTMYAEFYSDPDCSNLINKEAPQPQDFVMMDGQCHQATTQSCDKGGYHLDAYQDMDCSTKVMGWYFEWGTCTEMAFGKNKMYAKIKI